ncbi:hypothetical protein DN548_09395 [Burkholderia multivorans]|nr:hypothetical protein DN537_19950 [Burkholderia multivorans]RAD60644.1 hypothetical protein DN548_09395 [Burkholderia multivorans]
MAGPFRRERRAPVRARSVKRTDAQCGQQGVRRFRYADYPTRAARVSISLTVRRAAHVRRSRRRRLRTSHARSIARSRRRPFAAASPTQAPPTQASPTQAPPTQASPTQASPTQAPPTQAPPTSTGSIRI